MFAHPSLWAHIALIIIMLFALALCLWLFSDILTSRKELQILLSQSPPDRAFLERFQAIYRQEVWLDLLLAPILVLGIMVMGLVSFYFKTLRELRNMKSIDNYILQSITRGVLTVDGQSRVTSCNYAMQEIFGICREGCYRRPVETVLPADGPMLRMVKDAVYSQSQHEYEEEITYTRSDGKKLPLRVSISALRDEHGKLIGSILLVKNLTHIRSLEDRLKRQERLAALGDLTRRILHEIRNPLSAMDLNLQLLQEYLEENRKEKGDDRISRYFHIVFSELHRLDTILQNTHMSVHPPMLQPARLDLHLVIQEVLIKMQAQIRYAGHELRVNLVEQPAYILGDKNLLVQVFVNLFKNALEAMSENHGRLRVGSHLSKAGDVIIEVEDNGRGIDWQDLPRIFDPYFTSKSKGTGLGLSIVHNIVIQHGGDIHVGSWIGEGTLFELHFPAMKADSDAGSFSG